MDTCSALAFALFLVIFSDISRALSINKLNFEANSESNISENVTPELPPLIFPDDPKIYRIIPTNNTALEILQHKKSLKDYNTALEIIEHKTPPKEISVNSLKPQLQQIVSDKEGVKIFRATNMYIDNIPEEFPSDVDIDLKSQVEDIQAIDLTKPPVELEERFHQQSKNLQAADIYAGDIETGPPTLIESHLPVILAGVLAAVCFGLCASILCWRSYIERKYGKRVRLLDQEDVYPSDLRHIDL